MAISAQEHTWRSRTAVIMGAISLCLLIFGPLCSKWGVWPYTLGLLMVTIGFVGSLLPIALLIGFVWHPGYRRERGALILGAAMAAIPFAVAMWTVTIAHDAPTIHDISTDTTDPPLFGAAITTARGKQSNPLNYRAAVAQQQRAAYPDIKPIITPLPPRQALAYAADVAQQLGWRVVHQDERSGHIEAVATTRWFGFHDDVVIRVRAHDAGSRVDLRSVSRVGQGDLGANARRIRHFIDAFSGN